MASSSAPMWAAIARARSRQAGFVLDLKRPLPETCERYDPRCRMPGRTHHRTRWPACRCSSPKVAAAASAPSPCCSHWPRIATAGVASRPSHLGCRHGQGHARRPGQRRGLGRHESNLGTSRFARPGSPTPGTGNAPPPCRRVSSPMPAVATRCRAKRAGSRRQPLAERLRRSSAAAGPRPRRAGCADASSHARHGCRVHNGPQGDEFRLEGEPTPARHPRPRRRARRAAPQVRALRSPP